MAQPLAPLVVSAAQRHLRAGRGGKQRGLCGPSSLRLAGEVWAVAAGLKPALLYDYNVAGGAQVLGYVRQLQTDGGLGRRLHVLSVAENALVVNVDATVPRLEALLRDDKVSFVDVSAARPSPAFCAAPDVDAVKGHVSEILAHLGALAGEPARALASSSALFSAEWNLCTLFGVLLGYPAAYSFPARHSFDNCLALTPLRVFAAHATCRRISNDLRVRLYSFSVPENLYSLLKTGIDEWCEALQDAARSQKDFSDLRITTEVVTLEAVAL